MMKAMLVHCSPEMRRDTNKMSRPELARHLADSPPWNLFPPDDALRYLVRALAGRWLALDAESKELEGLIDILVRRIARQLLEQFGIGNDTAAEILIVAGDNPEGFRSEAAFAKLAGVAPVLTGSGMTSGKHRIDHGRHSQLNAAIYRTGIVRMRFNGPAITMSPAGLRRDGANATSSAASSATSFVRSTSSSK